MSVHLASSRIAGSILQACAIVCIVCFFSSPASAGGKAKILFSPKPSQGAHPWGSLAFDSAGNFYGTTQEGGIAGCGPQGRGCGTVFELTPQPDGSWTPHVIYQFQGGTDGDLPYAGVVFDGAGNLYAPTAAGGTNDVGTAYELSLGAGGWGEKLLYTFGGPGQGSYPGAPFVFDKRGNLYGTTYDGCGNGSVYELDPSPAGTWSETQLHCFPESASDGTYPSAPVIFDAAGNLYSTTYLGGIYGGGVVFELSPSQSGWTETILYSVGPSQEIYPWSSLVFDKQGNLYGLVYGGVFELTPSDGAWTYSTVYAAKAGSHGVAPNSLIIDAAGNLYGTAEGGASSNCHGRGCGAVFKLTNGKKGWKLTDLYDFPGGTGGADPYSGLIMDQAGNLYGATYDGGKKGCGEGGCGVVYEIEAP
ncbi:MAG: choice-of-anchor tandem repeat GloVer-containing protein [Terriglobales bacterium]|jgi:hypothetical protein